MLTNPRLQYMKQCSVFRVHCPAQKPEPKEKSKGKKPETERKKAEDLRNCCEVKQRPVKGIAAKLSTKAETEAWKQAEGNADKST